jgi:hypothetical protein
MIYNKILIYFIGIDPAAFVTIANQTYYVGHLESSVSIIV